MRERTRGVITRAAAARRSDKRAEPEVLPLDGGIGLADEPRKLERDDLEPVEPVKVAHKTKWPRRRGRANGEQQPAEAGAKSRRAAQQQKPDRSFHRSPRRYKSENAEQARKLALLGATRVELADFFGVNPNTIRDWQLVDAEFDRALSEGRAEADSRVERALFQRALGYSYEATKVFERNGKIVEHTVLQEVPPDTTACIFWLKNRASDRWRDIWRIKNEGEPGEPREVHLVISDMREAILQEVGKAAQMIEHQPLPLVNGAVRGEGEKP